MIKKYYLCLAILAAITIFVTSIGLTFTALENRHNANASEIESNSTSTVCINGKPCVTTICIDNQPCHTITSNSTTSTNNKNNNNNSSGSKNTISQPFPQESI
jgi:hypothetical protein